MTLRGYTSQEMMDTYCLVNLNARLYDTSLGRVLSADPTIPDMSNGQAFNRYSYVTNNPLSFTDPSGYEEACDGDDYVDPNDLCVTDGPTGGYGDSGGYYGGGGSTVTGAARTIIIGTIATYGADGTYYGTYNWYGTEPGVLTDSGGGSDGPDIGGRGSAGNSNYPCNLSGNAPSPDDYQNEARKLRLLSDASNLDPSGTAQIVSTSFTASVILSFRRGQANDAQAYGGKAAYANYAYGVFLAALGTPLSTSLTLANLYGACCADYSKNTDVTLDSSYSHIPQVNVQNITNGYNAELAGKLCHK
jgi:RHS repeat-associated protein